MHNDVYLRDTVTMYDTEMLVTVEPDRVFVDKDEQVVGKRTVNGKPRGYGRYDSVPQHVQHCNAVVAHIRPAHNRHSVSDEWPENAPTSKRVYDLIEAPVRRPVFRFLWTTEPQERDSTDQELAKKAVIGLAQDVDDAQEVKSLDLDDTVDNP